MSNLWTDVEELGTYADSDYAYEAVKTASYMLWALSGRKFSGVTTVTERYVSAYDPYLRTGASRLTYTPTLIDGMVENIPTGGFGRYSHHDFQGDGTSSYSRVRLRGRKVVEIHSLRDQNGNIIDPNTYYLSDHSTIFGTPNAKWSSSNVEVTYTYGSPPPTAGRAAARILALELVKLYEGDDTCALPQRVTSVARQGVSYTVLTPRARRIIGASPAFELSAYDLYFNSEGGTNIYYLNEFGGDFLLDDAAWTVYAVISNFTNTSSKTLVDAADLDTVEGTIRLSASYADILSVLGPRDPGTLDLYASRPSLGNPAVNEVINLLTSNVIYQLGNTQKPIAIV